MNLEIKDNNSIRMVIVKEPRIDMTTSRDFKEKVIANLANLNLSKLIINMHEVEYCDSSALGSLVSIYRETKSLQIDLKLCCLQSTIESLMQLAKLDTMLAIYETEEMALQ